MVSLALMRIKGNLEDLNGMEPKNKSTTAFCNFYNTTYMLLSTTTECYLNSCFFVHQLKTQPIGYTPLFLNSTFRLVDRKQNNLLIIDCYYALV